MHHQHTQHLHCFSFASNFHSHIILLFLFLALVGNVFCFEMVENLFSLTWNRGSMNASLFLCSACKFSRGFTWFASYFSHLLIFSLVSTVSPRNSLRKKETRVQQICSCCSFSACSTQKHQTAFTSLCWFIRKLYENLVKICIT